MHMRTSQHSLSASVLSTVYAETIWFSSFSISLRGIASYFVDTFVGKGRLWASLVFSAATATATNKSFDSQLVERLWNKNVSSCVR